MSNANQIAIAKAIATIAHRGQVDKSGQPYITHPQRVAARFAPGDWVQNATAWLHDVLEDTDVTADDLLAAGVDETVVSSVEKLTRTKDVSPEDYYREIRAGFYTRQVKLADIADNTDVRRLALLDDATVVRLTRKYAKALLIIGGESS